MSAPATHLPHLGWTTSAPVSEDARVEAPRELRALVTGASGYLGTHLCASLRAEGWQVHALLRAQSDDSRLTAGVASRRLTESVSVGDVVRETRPEVVFHLAAESPSLGAEVNVRHLLTSNVVFAGEVFSAAADVGAALVYTGSFSQTSGGAAYDPNSLYAASKQAAACLIEFYARRKSLRAATVRLPHIYGPNDWRDKLLARLARMSETDPPLALTPGEQATDFLYVDDAVNALVVTATRLLALSAGGHEIYSPSSGEIVSLRTVVELLCEVRGVRLPLAWGAKPYPDGEVMHMETGTPPSGWRPRVSLREGLARAV